MSKKALKVLSIGLLLMAFCCFYQVRKNRHLKRVHQRELEQMKQRNIELLMQQSAGNVIQGRVVDSKGKQGVPKGYVVFV